MPARYDSEMLHFFDQEASRQGEGRRRRGRIVAEQGGVVVITGEIRYRGKASASDG